MGQGKIYNHSQLKAAVQQLISENNAKKLALMKRISTVKEFLNLHFILLCILKF